MSDFKKCQQGHYYSSALKQCPFCPGGSSSGPSNPIAETKAQVPRGRGDETEVYHGGGFGDRPTEAIGGGGGDSTNVQFDTQKIGRSAGSSSNDTMFGEDVFDSPGSSESYDNMQGGGAPRSSRKLVGWLVSYTIDNAGVSFQLYEGKNVIGRDLSCNITVAGDNFISAKHAILLFRGNEYAISDKESSHGTYINNEALGFDTRILKDGDMIKMGKTIFKFRTSL